MNLNTYAAPANQSAVFEDFAAADCAHPLTESVLTDPFSFFWLINALWHAGSIAKYSLWYNIPDMETITKPVALTKVKTLAKNRFGNLVKAVVDIQKKIMTIDADLHSDEEAELLSRGSKQTNLWGINIYPDVPGNDFIEFDSMINVRPQSGNMTRGVDDPTIQQKIRSIVHRLITP
jgi:hypothetical protein